MRKGPAEVSVTGLDLAEDNAVRSANAPGEGAMSSPRGSMSDFPVRRPSNLLSVLFIELPPILLFRLVKFALFPSVKFEQNPFQPHRERV